MFCVLHSIVCFGCLFSCPSNKYNPTNSFRTRGVGAKPDTCKAVLDKFGTFDALAPMPLVAVEVLLSFVTPFLNFVSFLFACVFERRRGTKVGSGLPFASKFRMSKVHPMSGNDPRLGDFGSHVLAQWIAALAIIAHGVSSLFVVKKPAGKKTAA